MFSNLSVRNRKSEWISGSNGLFSSDKVLVHSSGTVSVFKLSGSECNQVGSVSGDLARLYASCTELNSQMLIFGGQLTRRYYSALEIFDLGSDRFVTRNFDREPIPRTQHLAVGLENSLFVIGGKYLGRALSDSYQLDSRMSRWNVRSLALPSGRYGMAGGLWQNQLVCYGGIDGRQHLNELLLWDLRGSKWQSYHTSGSPPQGTLLSSTLTENLLLSSTSQGLWGLDLPSRTWVQYDSNSEVLVSNSDLVISLGKSFQICQVDSLRKSFETSDQAKSSEEELTPAGEISIRIDNTSRGSARSSRSSARSAKHSGRSSRRSVRSSDLSFAPSAPPSDDYSEYSSDSDSDDTWEVNEIPPDLPPRNPVPLLNLPSSDYGSSDILTTSREVRDLRRQLAEQEVLLQIQRQRNEELRARILELQQERSVQSETESLNLLAQKNARILELEQEIETWMLESSKLQRLGEEAVNDLSKRYENLQTDFLKLKEMYLSEVAHRQELETKIPQLEALLHQFGA